MATAVRVNWWPNGKCAKAFWTQQELPSYKELLSDTLAWAAPGAGERWLDLGCGGGGLTRGLWEKSGGAVAGVLGVDCAAANESAYERLRQTLLPPPGNRIQFRCHDFSSGLSIFPDGTFDHAVSGLSITYAEHLDPVTGTWTETAYNRVLSEVLRVVKPGGRFVFSVNVPEPSWLAVAWRSLPTMLRADHPLRRLKNSWRLLKYGRWLKQEARTGRFLYLPAERVTSKLVAAGWTDIGHRLSYSRQAYVFHAVKPSR
jgi:SAM-dependent methyltransferase